MDKKIEELAAFLKSGSKIHIKKSQRGSFTRYCNGKVTSECIRRGKNSPDPKIRKKATFAANARKWKHAEGGVVDPEGFEGIVTTNNRPYNKDYVSYINETLRQKGLNKEQRASILANIIEESGGDPYAKNPNGFYGLLQWANNRYVPTKEQDPYKELDNQINYIISTKDNSTDKKSWTHGGTGSGFRSLLDAISAFKGSNLAKVMKGYTLGYVRPSGGLDAYRNRLKVAQQLYNLPGFTEGGNIGKYAKGKSLVYKPFTEQTENDELKYKPFIPDTIQDIVSDWTPQFPVEPVRNYTPIEQAPEQSKKESKQEAKTPKFEIQQVTAPKDAVVVNTPSVEKVLGNVEYKTSNMDVGNMQELIDLMKDEGISFRITSGHRPGAKTKSGKLSHHDTGNALDITPASGQTWDDLIAQMKKSSRFIEYMKSHGFGILDERGDAMQKRTGATGAHFHIGPDQIARTQFKYLIG